MTTRHSNHYYRFICPNTECHLKFNKRLDLRNHLIFDHNNIDLVSECPICKEKFSSLKELRVHEKIHGEFKCENCGKKFLEKLYLELHEKTHDTKREVFKCDFCNKKFFYKGNLNVHFKIKHLNQTHKCFICGRELSTNQKLKEHITKKHQSKNDLADLKFDDFDELIAKDKEPEDQIDAQIGDKSSDETSILLTQEDLDILQENFF